MLAWVPKYVKTWINEYELFTMNKNNYASKQWLTAKRVGHGLVVIIDVRWYAYSVTYIRYVHDYEHDYVSKYKYKTSMQVQDFK
jgi:hypothetical protein